MADITDSMDLTDVPEIDITGAIDGAVDGGYTEGVETGIPDIELAPEGEIGGLPTPKDFSEGAAVDRIILPMMINSMQNTGTVGAVHPSADFGGSKYDKLAKNPDQVRNPDELRGQAQTAGDKYVNGMIKLTGKLATNVGGGLVGFAYGVGNMVNEVVTKDDNTAQSLFNSVFNHEVFQAIDKLNESMDENLPHYYTQAERERGLMGNFFTGNQWMDKFANGISFLGGAVLTEMAAVAIGAGIGGVMGAAGGNPVTAGAGAITGGAAGAVGATRMLVKGIRAAKRSFRMGMRSRTAGSIISQGTRSSASIAARETLGTLRQVATGSVYESSIEATEAYNSMMDTMLDRNYGDIIAKAERRKGSPLSREEKLSLLNEEQRGALNSAAMATSNGVFASNLLLVSLGHMAVIGHLYAPKFLSRVGNVPKATRLDKGLKGMGLGTDAIAKLQGTKKWVGRMAYEGFMEEGLQGVVGRSVDSYAQSMTLGDGGVIDDTGSWMNHLATGMEDTYFTKAGMEEVILGMMTAGMGLPTRKMGGMLMSRDVQGERARLESVESTDAYKAEMMATIKEAQEKNPEFGNDTSQLLFMSMMLAKRRDEYEALMEAGDQHGIKNLEMDTLFDMVMYFSEVGKMDVLDNLKEEVDGLSSEDFKKKFQYDEEMTDTEVIKRKAEVKERTTKAITTILKAKKKIDSAIRVEDNEKFHNISDPSSIAAIRRNLIRYAALAELSDARIQDMIGEYAEITHGQVVSDDHMYDMVTYTDEEGNVRTMDIMDLNVGQTIVAQIAETNARIAELETTPKNISTNPRDVAKKLEELRAFVAMLEAVPNPGSSPLSTVLAETSSALDRDNLASWAKDDPAGAAIDMNRAKELLSDIRKLREKKIEFADNYRVLLDPNTRQQWMDVQEKAKKLNKKSEKELNKNVKKKREEHAEAAAEFKKRVVAYKADLEDRLGALDEELEQKENEIYNMEQILVGLRDAIINAEKKPDQKTFSVEGLVNEKGKKIRYTREGLLKQLDAAETFVKFAEEEYNQIIQGMKDERILLNDTIGILKEFERSDIDPDTFPGKVTDVHRALIKYSNGEGIELIDAASMLVRDYSARINYLDSLGDMDDLKVRIKVLKDKAKHIREFVENNLPASEDLTDEELAVAMDWDAILENIDQQVVGLQEQLAEDMAPYTEEIQALKKERQKIYDAFNSTRTVQVFNEVMAYQMREDGSKGRKHDIDKLEAESREWMDMGDDLWTPDIDDGALKTADLHGSYVGVDKEEAQGAINVYARISKIHPDNRSDEDLIAMKKAKAVIVFMDHLNTSGSRLLYRRKTSGGLPKGTVVTFIHKNNVPASLAQDLEGTFDEPLMTPEFEESFKKKNPNASKEQAVEAWDAHSLKDFDTRNIKAVISFIDWGKDAKGDNRRRIQYVRNKDGDLVYSNVVLPTLQRADGSNRYTNNKGISAKAEIQKLQKFREGILARPRNTYIGQITKKSQGSVQIMSEAEQHANGGLNFAEDAVMSVGRLKHAKIMVAETIKNKDPNKEGEYQLARISTNVGAAPEIMARAGTVHVFDHERSVTIPMRKQELSDDIASNVMGMYTKMLTEFRNMRDVPNEETGETMPHNVAARLAINFPLEHKGIESTIARYISDIVHTLDDADSMFRLNAKMLGDDLVIYYGLDDVLTLEDLQNPEKAADFKSFLMTKYHNVHKGRVAESVVRAETKPHTYYDKKKKKKVTTKTQKTHKFMNAGVPWVNFKVNADLSIAKNSKIHAGYNEYLLSKQGKGENAYSPLMTAARSLKAVELDLSIDEDGMPLNIGRTRNRGGYIRFNNWNKAWFAPKLEKPWEKAEEDTDDDTFYDDDDGSDDGGDPVNPNETDPTALLDPVDPLADADPEADAVMNEIMGIEITPDDVEEGDELDDMSTEDMVNSTENLKAELRKKIAEHEQKKAAAARAAAKKKAAPKPVTPVVSKPSAIEKKAARNSWKKISKELSKTLVGDQFKTWFEPLVPHTLVLSKDAKTLTLLAPSQFIVNWIYEHHAEKLEEAGEKILGEEGVILVEADPRISVQWKEQAAEKALFLQKQDLSKAPKSVQKGIIETVEAISEDVRLKVLKKAYEGLTATSISKELNLTTKQIRSIRAYYGVPDVSDKADYKKWSDNIYRELLVIHDLPFMNVLQAQAVVPVPEKIQQDDNSYYRGQVGKPTIDKDGNLVLKGRKDPLYEKAGLPHTGVSMTTDASTALDYGEGQWGREMNFASVSSVFDEEIDEAEVRVKAKGWYVIQVPKTLGIDPSIAEKELEEKTPPAATEVSEGVSETFKFYPELSEIGTQAQYSQYLKSIFPDTKAPGVFTVSSKYNLNDDPDEGVKKLIRDARNTNKKYGWPGGFVVYDGHKGQFGVKPEKGSVWRDNKVIINPKDEYTEKVLERPSQSRKSGGYRIAVNKRIHVLGTERDLEGFKKFVSETPTDGPKGTNAPVVVEEAGEVKVITDKLVIPKGQFTVEHFLPEEYEEWEDEYAVYGGTSILYEEASRALQMRPLHIRYTNNFLASKDGQAVAQLQGYAELLVSRLAPGGAIYHETFHDTSLHVLSKRDSELLYSKARDIKGTVTTYKGETKALKDMSDKEIEEWLAEEFRHYVLSEGSYKVASKGVTATKDTRNMIQKFFDLVSALIRRLTGRNERFEYDPEITSIEGLFEDITEGKFLSSKMHPSRSVIAGPYNMLRRMDGKDMVFTNDMMSTLSAYLGDVIGKEFDYNGTTIDPVEHTVVFSTQNDPEHKRSLMKLYKRAIANMRGDLIRTRNSLSGNKLSKERLKNIREAIEYFDNDPKFATLEMIDMHGEMLRQLSITEDVDGSTMEETERNSRDWVSEMDALERSSSSNASGLIKLILSTIPNRSEINSTGLHGVYNMSSILKTLHNELSHTTTFEEQMQELQRLTNVPGYEWAQEVIDRVDIKELDGKEPWQVRPRIAFGREFAQPNVEVVVFNVESNNRIYPVYPAKMGPVFKIQGQWSAALKAMASDASRPYVFQSSGKMMFNTSAKFRYISYKGGKGVDITLDQLKPMIGKERDVREIINMLEIFGLNFSNKENAVDFIEKDEDLRDEFIADASKIVEDVLSRGNTAFASLFDRKYADALTRVHRMVDIEVKTGKNDAEFQYFTVDRKMNYSIIRPHFVSLMANMKARDMGEFYNPQTYPFGTKGLLIDAWKSGKKVNVINMGGVNTDLAGTIGRKVSKMTSNSLAVMQLSAYLMDNKNKNYPKGIAILPRPGNQVTEFGLQLPIDHADDIKGILDLTMGYVYNEIAASAYGMDMRKHVKTLKDTIGELRLMKGLLTPEQNKQVNNLIKSKTAKIIAQEIKTAEDGRSITLENWLKEREDAFKDSIEARLERDVDALDADLVQRELLTGSQGSGYRSIYAVSSEEHSKGELVVQTTPEIVRGILEKATVRQFVAKNEMFQLFFRDPAYYSDMFKRMKGAVSTAVHMETSQPLLDWVNEDEQLFRNDGKMDVGAIREPTMRLQDELLDMMAEVLGEDSPAFEQYKENIEYGDGTFLVRLPAYRQMGVLTDQFSTQQNEMYKELRDSPDASLRVSEIPGGAFPSEKYKYFGMYTGTAEDGTEVPDMGYLKMSVSPIYEQLAHVNGKVYPNIKRMLKFMEDNELEGLVLPSAMKIGMRSQEVQTTYMEPKVDANGQVVYEMNFPDTINKEARMTLDLRFMGTQLEVSPFFKYKTTGVTQIKSHATSDLYENGEIMVDGAEDLLADFHRTLNAMTDKALQNNLEDWGISREYNDGRDKFKLSEKSYNKILNTLQEQGMNKNIGESLLGSIHYLKEKGGEFKFDQFVDRYRMETMFYSLLGNRIIRPKMFGEMDVQASDLGYEVTENENGIISDSTLKLYRKNGKLTMQMRVPHFFKQLVGKNMVIRIENGMIKINDVEMGEATDLLEAIGIRIPTDGIHSVEVVEIVDFLPQHAGPKVVVPAAIVVKSGSDFDIDKLTMFFMNYRYENGELSTIKFHQNKRDSDGNIIEDSGLVDWYLEQQEIHKNIAISEHGKVFGYLNTLTKKELEARSGARASSAYLKLFEDMPGLDEETTDDMVKGILATDTEYQKTVKLLDAYSKKMEEFMINENGVYLPKPFDIWREENPDADIYSVHSLKALQNHYVKTLSNLISLPIRNEEFLKPVGISNIIEISDEISDQYKKRGVPLPDLKKVSDFHTETTLPHLWKVSDAYFKHDRVTGIAAISATHSVKAQQAGPVINTNTAYETPDGRLIYAQFNFDFDHFNTPREEAGAATAGFEMLPFGNRFDVTDTMLISEMHSELVNAAVDGVNNPRLHILNLGPDLAPAGLAMLRARVPFKTISYFMNQPIVKHYMEQIEIHKGPNHLAHSMIDKEFRKDASQITTETRALFDPGPLDGVNWTQTAAVPLRTEELFDMIGKSPDPTYTPGRSTPITEKDILTYEEKIQQIQILDDLFAYMALGEDMTAVTLAQSFDTKLFKSRAHLRLIQAQYEEVIRRGVFPGIERITENEENFMASLKDYVFTADNILADLFIAEDTLEDHRESMENLLADERIQSVYREGYAKMVLSLTNKNNRLPMDEKVRVLEKFEQFYVSMILQSTPGADGMTIGEEAQRLLFGNQTMAMVIANIQNSIYGVQNSTMDKSVKIDLKKVISGGQTGVDRIGVEIAKELGLPTGGTAAPNFAVEGGYDTSLKEYGLKSITPVDQLHYGKADRWTPRTEMNVMNSDGTVYFATEGDSAGRKATEGYAKKYSKPFLMNPTAKNLAIWMAQNQISTLNIAGNRGSKLSEAEREVVKSVLKDALVAKKAMVKMTVTKQGKAGKKHPLADNPFIQSLLPFVQEDMSGTKLNDHIEPQFKAMNVYDEAAIVDGYFRIVKYDRENGTQYARDLAFTTLLQAGVMNTPFSFLDKIPGELFSKLAEERFRLYERGFIGLMPENDLREDGVNILLNKFAKNLVLDRSTIPYVGKPEKADHKKTAHQLFVKEIKPGRKTRSKLGEYVGPVEYILWKITNLSPDALQASIGRSELVFEKLDTTTISSRTYLDAHTQDISPSRTEKTLNSEVEDIFENCNK